MCLSPLFGQGVKIEFIINEFREWLRTNHQKCLICTIFDYEAYTKFLRKYSGSKKKELDLSCISFYFESRILNTL